MLGALKKLFERKGDGLEQYRAIFVAGAATAAQISVSPESALLSPSVQVGVRVRAETLGCLPLHLYQRDGESKKKAVDHPLYRLLHDRPNEWTSAAEFIMQMEQDAITHNNGAVALANRVGGKVVELLRLHPNSVALRCDPNTLEPIYDVTVNGQEKVAYNWRDILHIPNRSNHSAIYLAREAIGLSIAMERHASRILGNGGRPSGVLKVKGRLNEDVATRIKTSWNASHGGESSGGTAILEEGMEFEPLTFSSVDMQFQDMRAFQVIEISRALGVPPTLMMELGRATWANAEEMAQSFLSFTILPRAKLWQGAVARLLSTDDQVSFYPEFLIDELVKADIAARFNAYAQAISARVLNPNEARAKENLPPYEGGDVFANPNTTPAAPPAPPARTTVRVAA